MNASQRQNVLNVIDSFKTLNLIELFVNQYGSEAKPEEISAGDYSVADMLVLTQRVFTQLEQKINTPLIWQMLPATQNFNNDYGSCDLYADSSNLVSYIGNCLYSNGMTYLKSLIYYQIINGFWENSDDKKLDLREHYIIDLEAKIKLLYKHLNARKELLDELILLSQQTKSSLDSLGSEKAIEFQTLTNNLTESVKILDLVRKVNSDSQSEYDEIKVLKENSKNELKMIKECGKTINATQADIDKAQDESKRQLEEILSESVKKLTEIRYDHEFVYAKKEEVVKMMGYIADGTLSHSFNKRKEALKKQINKWLWICGFSSIATVFWIVIVFLCLSAETDNVWANIIINGVKSSPIAFVLGFAISQYQKERNLLEEYAFRESIAVTLTAYLDQMNINDNDPKRDLLIATVEKLYTKPVISQKEFDLLKFNTKDIAETAKHLVNGIEKLKSK